MNEVQIKIPDLRKSGKLILLFKLSFLTQESHLLFR